MKFDRNTIIGFVVLALLFFGYFYFNRQQQIQQLAYEAEKLKADSIENAKKPVDTTQKQLPANVDSVPATQPINAGTLSSALNGEEKEVIVQTDVFRVGLSSRGAQVKWVELLHFKDLDSSLVKLANSNFDKLAYRINNGSGNTVETSDLLFNQIDSSSNSDGSKTYRFTLSVGDSVRNKSITHSYTVQPNDYMIDLQIDMQGAEEFLTDKQINLTWNYHASQQESAIDFEKQNTQIGYVEDGEFDYHTIGRRSSVNLNSPVKWVGVRQRFFNSYLVAQKEFGAGEMNWEIPGDEKKTIVETKTNLKLQLDGTSAGLRLFYGPADYHLLRKYDLRLDKLINLGQGPYTFVRPLNRFIVYPVWDFIKGFVSNYGLVILFLTLFIRLLISPLSYKSYLSSAKMKALRPEIAALREKHGNDQQAMSMEQMKLFREAGVNPLGGCIPALLQIPIFFALFSFFSSNVDLRGAEFLWAKDLSAFDDVIKFGVKIPLLGEHLSIFTLTAVVTSLLISIYSMSMSPDQSNPILKYMPYIFPVFLLFIFNSLPSALTWYYTVSNLITLALQFVIQNYIIDHNKILAKIEENRKKPKTKSKWQERLEQMQEQQKKLKETQQRNRK
jgi:YidC/Oxa1 family membrane protein insertase